MSTNDDIVSSKDDIQSLETDLMGAVEDCAAARLLGGRQQINWSYFEQRAKTLGLDNERLERITRLAEFGFSWSETMRVLLANGLDHGTAEWIVDRMLENAGVRKSLYDRRLSETVAKARRYDLVAFRVYVVVGGGALAATFALAVWYL